MCFKYACALAKEKGMKGAVEKAEELSKTYESSFIPSQFENPSNPEIHYKTTGPEIYKSSGYKTEAVRHA